MSYVVKKRKGLKREFGELPYDCVYEIIRFLPLRDLFNILLVSKSFNEFYDHEIRWKERIDIHFGSLLSVGTIREEVNIERSKEFYKFLLNVFGFLPLKDIKEKEKKKIHSKEDLYQVVKEIVQFGGNPAKNKIRIKVMKDGVKLKILKYDIIISFNVQVFDIARKIGLSRHIFDCNKVLSVKK